MDKKLQVFISSTYKDLTEERQAAVQAILDAGHIPGGMELFKAGNESQLKTIYRWIDESDVYMLILGGRYGSIEVKSNKSYTQLEYEYALSKNIPVFSVVLSESFLTSKINEIGLTDTMEQIAPDKYQSFKSLVMSKIIREVDDCKDIKIAIHSTLNEFISRYNLIGWVRNTNKQHSPQSTDEYYFMKIVEIFKNKHYKYTHYSELEKNTYTVSALDMFIENYILFCFGIPTYYINDDNRLFFNICEYFEHFNIIEFNSEHPHMIKISQLGKSFFIYLKSKNIVNT